MPVNYWLLVAVFVPRGVVLFGLDDTIERRRGEQITAKGIYRDRAVLACAYGESQCTALAWVYGADPIAWAKRVWALPFLTVLCPSARFYAQRGRRHHSVLERAGKASGSCGAGCLIASWSSWRTAVLRPWNGSPWWHGCPVSV